EEVVEIRGAVAVPVAELDAGLDGGVAFLHQGGNRNAQEVQQRGEVRHGALAGAEYSDFLALHQRDVELRVEFACQQRCQPTCRSPTQYNYFFHLLPLFDDLFQPYFPRAAAKSTWKSVRGRAGASRDAIVGGKPGGDASK